MLTSKGQCIAHAFGRSLRTTSRKYAAAPLTKPLDDLEERAARPVDGSVKVTVLTNGIKVVSCDTGGSISRLNVATNVGSRHEEGNQIGISHLMKVLAFETNNERSSLRTVRETQEVGGTLECATTREFQIRNATFLRSKLTEILENITPGLKEPVYNPWDVSDALGSARSELATVMSNQSALNLEMLHKTAYRNCLGNSLYCNEMRLGLFNSQDFEEFSSNNFVGNRMTIAGTDINHDELVRYAKELLGDISQGQPQKSEQQKYYGGELHKYTDNMLTYASLVSEGAGISNADLASFLVLQRMLGGPTYVKWGSNSQSSRLSVAAKKATDGPLSINALNLSYSDSGLFGFSVITTPDATTPVLKAAVSQISGISKGEVSTEEFERAKMQTKAGVIMVNESKGDALDDMTQQVALTGNHVSPADACKIIDQVSKDKVIQVAKKMLSGNPSLVVSGNTTNAPYLDQLL